MSSANVGQSNEVAKKVREKFDIEKLKGQIFGYLTIVAEAEPHVQPDGQKAVKVLALCKCGLINSYVFANLKRGLTKSCGCLRIEQMKSQFLTNGQCVSGKVTPEYSTWTSIKERTTNPKNKRFKDYGGRGIVVCPEWFNSFETFLCDIGIRPSPKHSIERRKVNEGYNKDNCYWANIHQQNANKRNSNKTVGVAFDKSKSNWIANLQFNGKCVLRKRFNTEQEAIDARRTAEIEYKIYG